MDDDGSILDEYPDLTPERWLEILKLAADARFCRQHDTLMTEPKVFSGFVVTPQPQPEGG